MDMDGMSETPAEGKSGELSTTHRAALPVSLAAFYGVLALPVLGEVDIPLSIAVISALLAVVLVTLSVIDLRSFRLPDALTLPLIAGGFAVAWLLEGEVPIWRVAGALAGYLFPFAVASIYHRLRGRQGLGLGDAKLLAAAGAWLGLGGLPTVMLWATSTALLAVVGVGLLGRRIEGASRIPFGPFLALGFWLVWLYGPLA